MNIRKATDADRDRIVHLGAQGFNIPPRVQEKLRADYRPSSWRVADDAGTIVGKLRILDFGHWFGGREVSAWGISSVSVAAEARGRGAGSKLMREVLAEARRGGVAISTLYPATTRIYWSAGYGFANTRTTWHAKLDDLPQSAGHVRVTEFGDDALPQLHEAYTDLARAENGLVARTDEMWRQRVLHSVWQETEPYRYLVRQDGRVTGWIIYSYNDSKTSWRFGLECRDLFWRTPEAARALLSLATLHRSTAEAISWVGPPSDPIAYLVREDRAEARDPFRMMLRLIDVPAAFEARGYPTHVETALSFAVGDPVFEENAGPWIVQIAAGRAKVAQARDADARADVQTWASIWSGALRARDAVRLGVLTASPDAIGALEMMFAGPLPWIADFY